MMRDKIKKIIENDDGLFIARRVSDSYFKNNYFKLYQEINELFDDDLSFSGKLYLIYYGYKNRPTCKICGSNVTFNKFSIGFSKYCSMVCVGKDKNIQKKREETTNRLYGGKSTYESPILIEKIKKTNLEKYGIECPQKLDSIKNKIKKTNLEKYGVEYIMQSKDFINKSKTTKKTKYDNENFNNRNKAKKTNLEKYGVEYPQKLDSIKEKKIETTLKKYGVKYTFQSEIVKKKIKKTNLEKYGIECPQKLDSIKEKTIETLKKTKNNKSVKYWSDKLNLDINNITIENSEITINNLCDKHNLFTIDRNLLKNRVRNNNVIICTKCNPINSNISNSEIEILKLVNELCLGNIISNDRTLIKPYELDIYIPDKKLAIEFNGLYWHSNKQKFKTYHLDKTLECEKQGVQLLHIFEDEWIYKRDIVESIIKSKLGLIENNVYGRKTMVKEIIDNSLVRDFLDKNHIQGFIGGMVKLGLYYNDELISIMIFGKGRKSLGSKSENGVFEMLRFCNKINYNVVGGASKLLKYFIKNYSPNKIISYADRRYSVGNLYHQLGFNFIGETKINYWYFKNNNLIREHRFKYRKDVLLREGFSKNKTEFEIMTEKDYCWIYDCGNLKFEMII